MVEMAKVTNRAHPERYLLADALVGADAFLGFSAPGIVTTEMVKTMNRDAIILPALTLTPEIFRTTLAPAAHGSFPRAAATIPTRSTTFWRFPEFSAARWMCAPLKSMKK